MERFKPALDAQPVELEGETARRATALRPSESARTTCGNGGSGGGGGGGGGINEHCPEQEAEESVASTSVVATYAATAIARGGDRSTTYMPHLSLFDK